MNAIFVDRCWACLGELSWSYHFKLLRQQDIDINNAGLGTNMDPTILWLVFLFRMLLLNVSRNTM